MAVIPGAGYMVDPNNPNAVIPIGSSAQAQGMGSYNTGATAAPNISYGATTQQPAAQAPMTPAPQPTTPPAPSVTINNTTAPTQTAQPTQQPQMQMPTNGSVVDLLNAAGQDSSFKARQALAQQYGIQGYTGTAAQNQTLSKKYLDAYNAKKGTAAPQTGADARSAMNQYFQDTPMQEQSDPERSFFDEYLQMNPMVKSMFDAINQELSRPMTATSFKDEFAKLQTEQGIPGLNAELMDITNVMEGTEDDIRMEITKAGGFATESQVQAMKGARNKVLLKQANVLTQQLAARNDYVDQLMQFSQMDRAAVEKQVDRRLGLTEKLAAIQTQITSAAKENYQSIVEKVGYAGLSELLGGDKSATALAETSLGLPRGSLSNPSAIKLLTPPVDKKLQFISGTDNQRAGVFDPSTGKFTPIAGGGGGSGGGGTGYGHLPVGVRKSADSLRDAANNLASSFGTKFQKDAFMGQVDSLLERGDTKAASELIFSRAIQQIPDAEQRKKVTGRYEMTKRLNQIESLLDDYYAKGGTTGYFRGTSQQIQERFGESGDKELAQIGTTIMNAIDELVRFRTGAALTAQEDAYYQKMLPGTWKSAELNEANINGLRDSLSFDVESSLQTQLTVAGYQAVTDALVNSAIGMTPMPTGGKTGTLSDGTKVTIKADGTITDAAGNRYDKDGNRISGMFTGQKPQLVTNLK